MKRRYKKLKFVSSRKNKYSIFRVHSIKVMCLVANQDNRDRRPDGRSFLRSNGRVADCTCLLNRRTLKTGPVGSNPTLTAIWIVNCTRYNHVWKTCEPTTGWLGGRTFAIRHFIWQVNLAGSRLRLESVRSPLRGLWIETDRLPPFQF